MLLDKCNEACGYAAAITAAICLGSFGVPVKSEVVKRLDVDPLVVQSYKTIMCFLTSWLILLSGEPLRFTKWGIVSGLFWVPGKSKFVLYYHIVVYSNYTCANRSYYSSLSSL